jgi:hypothetical protein
VSALFLVAIVRTETTRRFLSIRTRCSKAVATKTRNCLTVHFLNQRAKEVFLTKCGAKIPQSKNNKQRAPGDTITFGPNNCGAGGAGTLLRHMTLMSNNDGAFLVFSSVKILANHKVGDRQNSFDESKNSANLCMLAI